MDALGRSHEQIPKQRRRPPAAPVERKKMRIEPSRMRHVARAKSDERELLPSQMRQSLFEMIREPQIIVRHVRNERSRRRAQDAVAKAVAESRRLRKPMKAD